MPIRHGDGRHRNINRHIVREKKTQESHTNVPDLGRETPRKGSSGCEWLHELPGRIVPQSPVARQAGGVGNHLRLFLCCTSIIMSRNEAGSIGMQKAYRIMRILGKKTRFHEPNTHEMSRSSWPVHRAKNSHVDEKTITIPPYIIFFCNHASSPAP